jgi:uncharacterized membrane protein
METTRLEAFSDGVFAVAITLLVLDLHVPDASGNLGHQLWIQWPNYAAYAVSFLIIGIIWVNHHGVFSNIARADRPLMYLNLLLLMAVVLIPFATALFAHYIRADNSDAHIAGAVYGATMFAMSLAYSALWVWATREAGGLLHQHLDVAQARAALMRFGAGLVFYAGTIGLAFVNAPLTLAVHFLLALYYAFNQLRVGGAGAGGVAGEAGAGRQ